MSRLVQKKATQATKATGKHLSKSSRAYLNRQFADPFVQRAQAAGYRSRAAFKLLEIQEKCRILDNAATIVDLGCAPGSWCQVAREINPTCTVVGIDLLPTDPLAGCVFIEGDFAEEEGLAALEEHLPEGGVVDVVMSDMAANTIGHRETDGLRTQALVEMAADFARKRLKIGGHFVTKMFMHGGEKDFQMALKPCFEKVVFVKPAASRKDSRELFLVAMGFLGEVKGR